MGESQVAIKNVFEETQALKAQIENLSVEQLVEETDAVSAGDSLLLDLREIQEVVDLGTIPNAKHVPRGMMEFWADPSSPYFRDYFGENKRTIVFCAGGGRSVYATLALQEMGFKDVAHLEVGFNGWKKAGQAVEDVAATSKWVRR
ncbi:MAG: rhodanese-related sulfurtransferase [Limisphaerales bacterium]